LAAYIAERHRYLDLGVSREQMVERQREEWREMVEHHRKERADIFEGSWRGRGELLSALRSITAARQAQEKAELRDEHRLERVDLARERGLFPTYEQWLSARDRNAADEWRHRERRPATLAGPTFKMPTPHDIRCARALQDGGR